MSNYRRAVTSGGSYFFTVVTNRRRPLFSQPESRRILRTVIREVREALPFTIDAWVLLPEHIHCIWTLPDGDSDYSKRWGIIKAGFSKQARSLFHPDYELNSSRTKHREATIWQRRFWEHQIRDQSDFNRHKDYIYWNPVKHGHVARVVDWPYSTFHRDVKRGLYPSDWDTIPRRTSRRQVSGNRPIGRLDFRISGLFASSLGWWARPTKKGIAYQKIVKAGSVSISGSTGIVCTGCRAIVSSPQH